jgi:cellobiose phosphorylase
VPIDQPGRTFYLRDRANGDFWSAAWQPVGKPLDRYASTCRFGTGYAVIASQYEGIATETTYFVPQDAEFEVWWLRVTNTGSAPRQLSVFPFAEFPNEWNMMNDLLNLQYSAHIGEARMVDGMVQASSCSRLPADPANFANRDQSRWWWMAMAGAPVAGYDLDREKFLGMYHGFHNPAAVEAGRCGNSEGSSDNLCGALQADLELAPGASRDVIVLLGVGMAKAEGRAALRRCGDAASVTRELEAVKRHWHAQLDVLNVRTPDPDFDHMVNVWNPYNALITFAWSRSCSLVYTGEHRDGLGYRDSVQDVLGVAAATPVAARERLELMLSGQDATGGAQPEVKPWQHKPGQMKPTPPEGYRSDDCLWLFNAVPAYVDETGDEAFYRKVIPYADKGSATVLGHLRRALEFNLERTGAHGLPCGLLADWNDCLKLGYRGESAFVAFQVRYGLDVYAKLCERMGETAERDWARTQLQRLDAAIQATCWDGDWFIWAIAEDGTVFGTHESPEGQVYLNTQAWAVLSGAATPEQTTRCLDTVKARLATPYGAMLCDPPFDKTPVAVMRAVLFNPGNKENGGIFSHTQSWAVLAEIFRGNADLAYAYYRAFLPAAQNDSAELREIEPYVHCQSTLSPRSPKAGTSRVPWLSGTASWACTTASQWILGIRPETDGLRIDPCIPSAWDGFSAERTFRGKRIHIEISNPSHVVGRVRELRLDGKVVEGNVVPATALRDGLRIEATIAPGAAGTPGTL